MHKYQVYICGFVIIIYTCAIHCIPTEHYHHPRNYLLVSSQSVYAISQQKRIAAVLLLFLSHVLPLFALELDISGTIQYVNFCVRMFDIMLLRIIHVVHVNIQLFFFSSPSSIALYKCYTEVFFNHSLVDTHLGCFQFETLMSKIAMNILVQVFYKYVFHSFW